MSPTLLGRFIQSFTFARTDMAKFIYLTQFKGKTNVVVNFDQIVCMQPTHINGKFIGTRLLLSGGFNEIVDQRTEDIMHLILVKS